MTDDAQRRWRDMVEARRVQMDAAYDALGRTSADFWTRRAPRFRRLNETIDDSAPLVQRVLGLLPADGRVLDVGAGTGRFALPIARRAARVIALEPSGAMLDALRESADDAGLRNVETVQGGWLESEAALPAADVVLCAHVLYPHAEIGAWIQTLTAHARKAVVLEMVVLARDPAIVDELWQRFHGEPRVGQPGLGELYPVLVELGIAANVEVYPQTSANWRFASIEDAVAAVREQIIVAETPENDATIRAALERELRDQGDGLALPHTRIVASVWWPAAATARPV
jgi:SAM-dependent methyltransferase